MRQAGKPVQDSAEKRGREETRRAAAYNSRSKAFEARGQFDRAIADHKKAIEIGLP